MCLIRRLFLHAVNFFSFPFYVHPRVSLRMCLPLFPGRRNHVDVIRFMTDGPGSPSLSHGARREKER